MKNFIPIALAAIILLQIFSLWNNRSHADQNEVRFDSTPIILKKIEALVGAKAKNDCTIVKINNYYKNEKIFIDSLPDDSLLPFLRAKLQNFDSLGKPQNIKGYDL
jgi:hypothetical protein